MSLKSQMILMWNPGSGSHQVHRIIRLIAVPSVDLWKKKGRVPPPAPVPSPFGTTT